MTISVLAERTKDFTPPPEAGPFMVRPLNLQENGSKDALGQVKATNTLPAFSKVLTTKSHH